MSCPLIHTCDIIIDYTNDNFVMMTYKCRSWYTSYTAFAPTINVCRACIDRMELVGQ
jgi:hypothetical protein